MNLIHCLSAYLHRHSMMKCLIFLTLTLVALCSVQAGPVKVETLTLLNTGRLYKTNFITTTVQDPCLVVSFQDDESKDKDEKASTAVKFALKVTFNGKEEVVVNDDKDDPSFGTVLAVDYAKVQFWAKTII